MPRSFLIQIVFLSSLAVAQEPMCFIENKGQIKDNSVLFTIGGTDATVTITTSGIDLILYSDRVEGSREVTRMAMKLKNASIDPSRMTTGTPLPGHYNYYYPHCPEGITYVKSYDRITFHEVYPKIDWQLSIDLEKGLMHDLILHPGADPDRIELLYSGAELASSATDRLIFTTSNGIVQEGRLIVIDKKTSEPIDARFHLSAEDPQMDLVTEVSYELGAFDPQHGAIIDPPLQWSMPQSSSAFDQGNAIAAAIDGSGDVLITGSTWGSDLPDTLAFQGTLSGTEDMVITRLAWNGQRKWSTYYGGSQDEQGRGITTDQNGNCYVAGTSGSSDLPVLSPLQATYGGGVYDMAILKFDPDGIREWASLYGGSGIDFASALTTDQAGSIYITGYSNSEDLVTAGDAIQPEKNIAYDGVIMKIGDDLSMQWCTWFGGNDDDKFRAIDVDQTGNNIVLAGSSLSSNFPTTNGVLQQFSASGLIAEDIVITKLGFDQELIFSSYCGGSGADFGQGVSVDPSGNIHVTGYTFSENFPTAFPDEQAYADSTLGSPATHDAFILKCDPAGSDLLWSTYFGGSNVDLALAIDHVAGEGIHICGHSTSTDLPVLADDSSFFQGTHSDEGSLNDMFIASFDDQHQLIWSTYHGSAFMGDEAYGISAHNGQIFVTGLISDDLAALKFGPDIITSIQPVTADELLILHNTSADLIQIRVADHHEPISWSIIDVSGKVVMHRLIDNASSRYSIEISSLPAGSYLLRCDIVNGRSISAKFVKR